MSVSEIRWSRVMRTDAEAAAGIVNAGSYLAAVCGTSDMGTVFGGPGGDGQLWISTDHGRTWSRAARMVIEGSLGFASNWAWQGTGMLSPKPGTFIHPEDGAGPSSATPGVLKSHDGPGQGTPIATNMGWTQWGSPCLNRRKDSEDTKFGLWPGEFLLDTGGPDGTLEGPLLLELTQGGATTLTTAFMLHQLAPGNPAYVQAENGQYVWIWVTTPPRIGSSDGLVSGLFTDGYFFFWYSSTDGGRTWYPYSDNQNTAPHPFGDADLRFDLDGATQVIFLDENVVLSGMWVNGFGPILLRSTQRGLPGTWEIIYMPGIYYQGSGGLIVMTHAFCQMDDGTVIAAGGAPEGNGVRMSDAAATGGIQGPAFAAAIAAVGTAYHYPQVWRSTDKGKTWTNVSLSVGDFATTRPLDSDNLLEGRVLLNLGDNCAFLAIYIESVDRLAAIDPNWTPFYLSTDGGLTFQKCSVPRTGALASDSGGLVVPIQAAYTNEGNIVVILHDNLGNTEIWLGEINKTDTHRAVGFLEQKTLGGSSFHAIPENELIRG